MEPQGTALVTGASRGIGRATAWELARRGFDVVASMRDPADGEALAGAAAESGYSLRLSRLDVTRPDSIEIPSDLRVLVNNAGVEASNLPVEHTPAAQWRELFETNVFGLAETTRLAIPTLRSSGGGVICNVTSCSLLVPMPFFAVYRASKAAVAALGESLRAELAPFGIRIVEILPGAIETDMLAASPTRPKGAACPGYEGLGERVASSRAQAANSTTTPERAAVAIVDAILDDSGPLRHDCDAMGAALLASWRGHSDEETMAPILELFCEVPDAQGD